MTHNPLESKHFFSHDASIGYTILNTEDCRNGSKLLTKICDLECTRKKKSLIRWQSIHEEDVGLPVPCKPQNSKGICPSADKPNYISFSREDCDLGKALPPSYQMLVRHQANHTHRSDEVPFTVFLAAGKVLEMAYLLWSHKV